MIVYIFFKELQYYLLNRSMLFTWALIIGLFVLNTSISVFQYNDLQKKHEEIVKKNDQKREFDADGNGIYKKIVAAITGMPYEQTTNILPDMVLLSQELHQPPSSLMFVSGASDGLIPDGSKVKCLEEPEFASFVHYNPYMNSYFSIDWTTVMIYVISFLCICFSYNAFSGEREDGTLKLMLANGLSRSSIIVAKFIGLLVVFLIPVLLGIMISCLLFELSPAFKMEIGEYTKIAYFFLISVLLISLVILMGFLVSSLTQKSYVSLIICLVCWTMMVIIIPNVSWIITRQNDKVPTENTVMREEQQQKKDLADCYMGWQGPNTPIEKAIDRKNCIDRQTTIHNSLWSGYHNMQFEQTHNAIKISKISPFGLFRFLSDQISGNNYYGYLSFFDQVKNYQLAYREYIINKDKTDQESHHLISNDWTITHSFMSQQNINPTEVPKFSMQPISFGQVVSNSLGDVLILCLWCVGLFAATFVAFVKYDVR